MRNEHFAGELDFERDRNQFKVIDGFVSFLKVAIVYMHFVLSFIA